MQLVMDHIPPMPPGLLAHPSKHDGHNGSTNQLKRKAHGKKSKPSLDSHEFWIGVYVNSEGTPEVRSSLNAKHLRSQMRVVAQSLFQLAQEKAQDQSAGIEKSVDVQDKGFQNHDTGFKPSDWHGQRSAPPVPFPPGPTAAFPFQTNRKRCRVDCQMLERGGMVGAHTISPTDASNGTMSGPKMPSRRMLEIMVSDKARWEKWFANAFTAIQQQACRFIAKEWIKLIHPKKQSTHPYNGNFPRNQRASSDRTRPPYWPLNVIHKEPDHIDKEARTNLLVHLLMHTPQDEITPATVEGGQSTKEIYARDLLETLTKKKDELKDKWDIIEDVIHARSAIENYNDGGCDHDLLVNVADYQENNRIGTNGKKQRVKSSGNIKGESRDALEGVDEGQMLSPTPIASPTDSMDTPAESDHEEDYSALTASFTSNVTQGSSLSSAPTIQPKVDTGMNGHMHCAMHNQQQPLMIQDSIPPQNSVGFDHHHRAHHRQPVLNPAWPVPPSADHRDYAHVMMMPQAENHPPVHMVDPGHYDHDIFVPPHPNNMTGVMALQSYHEPQQFGFDYGQDMNGNVPYRNIQEMDASQEYMLHNEYRQVNATHPQPHRH